MKKVAVVGFGFMGKTHVSHILRNSSLELVAIVDKNPEAVEKGLKTTEGNLSTGETGNDSIKKIHTYTTLEECIRMENPDAVHVCVHTGLHYAMVKEALSHGLHVLVEKPFCLDPEEGDEIYLGLILCYDFGIWRAIQRSRLRNKYLSDFHISYMRV